MSITILRAVFICSMLPHIYSFLFCASSVPHCVEVDVCSQKTSTGQEFPRNEWLHRSNESLWVHPGEYSPTREELQFAYAYYAITEIATQAGVNIFACEPDFALLRSSLIYTCNVQSLQKLSCVETDKCENVSFGHHRTQLLKYELQEGWSCDFSGATSGHYLYPTQRPNTRKPCKNPDHKIFQCQADNSSNCCDFTCDPGYRKQNGSCVVQCPGFQATGCFGPQKTDALCVSNGITYHTCSECPEMIGFGVVEWHSRQNISQCEYESCQPGTFQNHLSCKKCDAGTTSSFNATACTACPFSTTSTQGAAVCVPCFQDETSVHGSCRLGEFFTRNLSFTSEFLQSNSPDEDTMQTLMSSFCDQNYACLPCPPGTYGSQSQCLECQVGSYQPNYASTTCYNCTEHKTTRHAASRQSSDCLCLPGYENEE